MTSTRDLALGARLEQLLHAAEDDGDRDACYTLAGIIRAQLNGTRFTTAVRTALPDEDHDE